MRAEDPVLIARRGIIVGHGAHQGLGDSTVSLSVSCRQSSCSFVCPPLVRPAPGISYFPSPSVLLPPLHVAFGCDDVGDRRFSFGAGASVAQSCSFVSVASVGSSVSVMWYIASCRSTLIAVTQCCFHSSFREIFSE